MNRMMSSVRLLLAWLIISSAITGVSRAQTPDVVRINKMIVVSDGLPEADRQRLISNFEKNEFRRDEIQGRVERLTQGMGYITAVAEQPQVSPPGEKSATVTVTVHEGNLFRLADIQFVGADDFPPDKLRAMFPLNEGDRFESAPIGSGLNKLSAFFVSCGYSQVTVAPALNLDSSSSTVHLTIDVTEGPRLAAAVCR
jgi:outer membrane protein assembly factor BamA